MWKVIQCAVQGRGHIEEKIPCQDKTYCCEKDGLTVIALADGAGSAKYSHLGAEHIVQYICVDFAKNFDLYFSNDNGASVKKAFNDSIKNQINELAKEIECKPNDLASTLLVAAVKDNRYILLHIGDGVIGYSKNHVINVASNPENGEFVNTTIFTTSRDSLQTMRLLKGNLGLIDGFVLMSDGTEASLYDKKKKQLAHVLERIMKMMYYIPKDRIESQLLQSFYSVIRNATFDDCSIAIMAYFPDEFPGFLSLDENEKKEVLVSISKTPLKRKQILRYIVLLEALIQPQTVQELSKIIHLKEKYTKKRLQKLIEMNLIEKQGNTYQAIIIM